MAAASVLDVGCGTGGLLRRARDAGHKGRLCGLDPAPGMLFQARERADIEWILGDLASVRWDREFVLVVMTGHAFQVFLEDDEIRAALKAIRSALTDDGRFAFETRNPLAREWERWTPDRVARVSAGNGDEVRLAREVQAVEGDRVSFAHIFTSANWDRPQTSRSTLRFLDAEMLSSFLSEAGFAIEEQFGDWGGRSFTDASPEIITIARADTPTPVPYSALPIKT
jgi:SAM-dependent methyltransferase